MYADTTTDPRLNVNWGSGNFGEDSGEDSDGSLDPEFITILDRLDGIDRENIDLYAILGVGRDASDSEIRSAYRHLSLLLHPDKHSNNIGDKDPPNSTVAEAAFGRVASAYAILSDPKQRAVYDNLGYKGKKSNAFYIFDELLIPIGQLYYEKVLDAVKEHGLQLANCTKSNAELRLEYLLLKQKAQESKELQLTQPTSEFSLGLDMTDTFDRYLKESPDERYKFPMPNVYELSLAQSVTAGLSLKNSVTLAGQVTAHNGLGIGTGLFIWRHVCGRKSFIGPTTIDTEISYGRGGHALNTGIRARRSFGDRFVGTLGLSFTSWSPRSKIIIAPGLSAGLNVQLSPRVHTRLEFRCLNNSGISSELCLSPENEAYSARLSGRLNSLEDFSLLLRLEKPVSWSWLNPPLGSGDDVFVVNPNCDWAEGDYSEFTTKSEKGLISCSIGLNSIDFMEFTLAANCNVSSQSRFLGQIRISLERGVSLKLSLLRGNQTYSFPIQLSNYPDTVAIGYGFFVPFIVFAAIRTLIYEPYIKQKLRRAQKARRSKFKSELVQKFDEALLTQDLMHQSALRIKKLESSVSGLIINRAVYGCLRDLTNVMPDNGERMYIDVTIPLQVMVDRSQIKLPPGRWSHIQGFRDPTHGFFQKHNQLRVLYTFQDSPHEVMVSENQGLAIPMTKHKIEQFQEL